MRQVAGPFRTVDELELATLSWAHWFNENRLHSSIGYLTPIEAEERYYREMNPQSQPALGEPALHYTRGDSIRRNGHSSLQWSHVVELRSFAAYFSKMK